MAENIEARDKDHEHRHKEAVKALDAQMLALRTLIERTAPRPAKGGRQVRPFENARHASRRRAAYLAGSGSISRKTCLSSMASSLTLARTAASSVIGQHHCPSGIVQQRQSFAPSASQPQTARATPGSAKDAMKRTRINFLVMPFPLF